MDISFSQTEGSISPSLPHIFSTIKIEPADNWNSQSRPPSNGIAENYSTYTSLEAVHPESSYQPFYTMNNNLIYGSHGAVHQSYSFNCEDSNVPMLPLYYNKGPPDYYFQRDDEGFGSSPSSFNSSSPPAIVNEQMPPTSSATIQQYYGKSNERNSPGDSGKQLSF